MIKNFARRGFAAFPALNLQFILIGVFATLLALGVLSARFLRGGGTGLQMDTAEPTMSRVKRI